MKKKDMVRWTACLSYLRSEAECLKLANIARLALAVKADHAIVVVCTRDDGLATRYVLSEEGTDPHPYHPDYCHGNTH